jgi:hypothetical protein
MMFKSEGPSVWRAGCSGLLVLGLASNWLSPSSWARWLALSRVAGHFRVLGFLARFFSQVERSGAYKRRHSPSVIAVSVPET